MSVIEAVEAETNLKSNSTCLLLLINMRPEERCQTHLLSLLLLLLPCDPLRRLWLVHRLLI